LDWERLDENVTSRIKYQLDNVSVFNENDWPKMNKFMIENGLIIHNIFKDILRDIR